MYLIEYDLFFKYVLSKNYFLVINKIFDVFKENNFGSKKLF